jgi:uncharacterized protein (DUF934 family)
MPADGAFPLPSARPRRILREGVLSEDTWTWLGDDERAPARAIDVVVSLARWRRERDSLRAREGRLGVALASAELAASIADELPQLALVAIHVPSFVDGRVYSTGRLLRMRYGYRGELRAFGEILPDQLLFLRRCGFDSVELRADQPLETARRALEALTVAYQGAEDTSPLYRRRT